MTKSILRDIFKRDLERLKNEIALFKNEENMWLTSGAINNSAGNLALHLVGNLHTYIGAALGDTGYVRDREKEFSTRECSQEELINKIESSIVIVDSTLEKITEEQLGDDFPIVIWDRPTSVGYTLIHLSTHLNYHLGQVNYHRRLLDHP
ncbi:MAG: DinB family protein [Chitinophagaceae bacterium]|nr:MAG: DinB family protein [Chitinophagaceae bacterium]